MSVVSISFTAKGNKKIVGAINSMAVAIEETGLYGADFDYEEGSSSFEASVENLDLEALLGWVTIFQTALKENGRNRFSFTMEGIADNDYGAFTAFQIKCTQSMISKKEKDFERRTSNPPLQMHRTLSGGNGGCSCQMGIRKPHLTSCGASCVHEKVAIADFEYPLYIGIDEDAAHDFDARQEAIWEAEDAAMEALGNIVEELVVDVEYDSDEYDAANDALVDYFDEMQ